MHRNFNPSEIIPITQLVAQESVATTLMKNSTCPYCGVGCGVDLEFTRVNQAAQSFTQLHKVTGTPEHPANFGRLCVKGSKLLETNDLSGRLLRPKIADKDVSWSEATSAVASKLNQVIREHGPDSVAFYVSGQLLTEDYYVANKLMKGYIGSANIDTNSRLCMSSAVAAYKRAFGADTVPCSYEDLELADTIILVGSNAAWTHPVLFQRIERAKKLNAKQQLIVIDPRKTATTELADIHLPIKSGTDSALFNGLLHYINATKHINSIFIEQQTQGFSQVLESCEAWTPVKVAEYCDISLPLLLAFYAKFISSENTVTAYSMGVNQSSSGVDKANAIINCHLATGKLGKPGNGPFSLTGQPNAMGGREVGGLANMLAAHMDLDNSEHRQWVQEYWQSPAIAQKSGVKAVDMFEQIAAGKIKAVWIMATNPVVSMPNRNKIISALKQCELVVVSDCVANNDTLAYADIALPATGWSEKDGTVTNSERRISRQRAVLEPAGEAKHDWQIISDVATAMGFSQGFNYSQVAEIFREHAGLSGVHNNNSRDFDISGLSQLSQHEYEQLKPIQWPVNVANPYGTKRMFTDGIYYTPSTKAQFISIQPQLPQLPVSAEYPFVLNSGRVRDQWHTMTRTGKTAELSGHTAQAELSMHPSDAQALGLIPGDLVELKSSSSEKQFAQVTPSKVVLPVKLEESQRKGELFAPIHWSGTNASSSAIASLYSDARDPISGQPELKHVPVSVEKVTHLFRGSIFSPQSLSNTLLDQRFEYWTSMPLEDGMRIDFATEQAVDMVYFQHNFPLLSEWFMAYQGHEQGATQRLFALREQRLGLAVFVDQQQPNIEPAWIQSLLQLDSLQEAQKSALLRGLPDPQFSQGRLICSCFKVGEQTIIDAIEGGCASVDSLGEKLQCGTNCGSCKSELKQLINTHQLKLKSVEHIT